MPIILLLFTFYRLTTPFYQLWAVPAIARSGRGHRPSPSLVPVTWAWSRSSLIISVDPRPNARETDQSDCSLNSALTQYVNHRNYYNYSSKYAYQCLLVVLYCMYILLFYYKWLFIYTDLFNRVNCFFGEKEVSLCLFCFLLYKPLWAINWDGTITWHCSTTFSAIHFVVSEILIEMAVVKGNYSNTVHVHVCWCCIILYE